MEELKLNQTPVRTSRNFNINNIKLKDIEIPSNIKEFGNVTLKGENIETNANLENSNPKLTYGIGLESKSNVNIRIEVKDKETETAEIDFKFNEENKNLVENIEIIANENTKQTIILKYEAEQGVQGFHNGIVKVLAKAGSKLNVILLNLLNESTNNFISIENELEAQADVKYTVVDFGGKNSITNYYSNLKGEKSNNVINTIYLANKNQVFDLNYIGELRGEKSNIDIDVQGAIKDNATKNFKGTIDFKRGCKKAKGSENEYCTILSDTAKSLALPMLLCSEEEVEGEHATSAGKIGEKELFYMMSRGFKLKEALKLMIRAKFNKVLENIEDEKLKEQVLEEIDKRLD